MFTCRFQQYQLTVECDTTEDGSGDGVGGEGVGCEGGRHLSMGALIQRRKKFVTNITKITRTHHEVRKPAFMIYILRSCSNTFRPSHPHFIRLILLSSYRIAGNFRTV